MTTQTTPKIDATVPGTAVGSDGAAGQSRSDHGLAPTERSLEMLRQLNSMFNEWEESGPMRGGRPAARDS